MIRLSTTKIRIRTCKGLKQAVKTSIGCFMIIMMNPCYANKSKMSKIESSF